jgi:DNA-binding FadR family transcriptional regulator
VNNDFSLPPGGVVEPPVPPVGPASVADLMQVERLERLWFYHWPNMPSRSAAPTVKTDASAPEFQAIRSTRAFEEIAAQIRNELAHGRLKVGNRLPSERALAEKFGVSRNTLREALRSLEHAGLVRLQKGASGGAFITEATGSAITTSLMDMYHVGAIRPEQLTEARIWLEAVIVRAAVPRATAADIAELKANIAQAGAVQDDFELRSETHFEFHRILARMTGNPIMVVMMDGLVTVLRHFVRSVGAYDNKFVLPSRRRFIKLMEEKDAEGAVAEMEFSLKKLQRGYLSRAPEEPQAQGARASAAARKTA